MGPQIKMNKVHLVSMVSSMKMRMVRMKMDMKRFKILICP
ncbi:hypothetical protein M6B38_103290 [Iris pallida]|uniref:Uncharacterized protein n=1 Tax=Iris pallida TaxID=29817 RepID=A0AAX6FCC2_IRIPA|nr:hypothetical protein M6B38_103290 [Iris pallida]